ncbi:MAG: hypothetical protein HY936_08005, partial [Nitrosomonadales bacterium]|nr:hypothetical protein [Nitrosomonadales bacterium]
MQGAARSQWPFHWQAVQRRRRRAQPQPGGPFACGRIAALRPACGEWLHGAARASHCIPQ